jgi:hypothetical protein
MASEVVAAATANPALIGPASALLGQAADPYTRSLARNYLHAQFLMRDVVENLSFNFLAAHNLDDHGTQFISVANYYFSDRWRISANFIFNTGGTDTEYGRYIDRAAFIGLKFFY